MGTQPGRFAQLQHQSRNFCPDGILEYVRVQIILALQSLPHLFTSVFFVIAVQIFRTMFFVLLRCQRQINKEGEKQLKASGSRSGRQQRGKMMKEVRTRSYDTESRKLLF